ncbi:MAG: DUF416 family protein [Candidatus Malihini olakiniferum]
MLRNPIHLRLEKQKNWQHVTLIACFYERMHPNYYEVYHQTDFSDARLYRHIFNFLCR